MLKKWNTCCLVLGSLVAATSVSAATPIDLKQQPASYLQSFLSSANKSLTSATAQSSLQQLSTNKDFNQTSHVRYQQMFAGYPVWGADFVVHVPEGKSTSLNNVSSATTMNGVVYQDLQKDLAKTPEIVFSSAQAEKALQFAMNSYQKDGKVKGEVSRSNTKLMVYVDKENKAHYAFLINFLVTPKEGIPAKPTFILDANSFTIFTQWDDIKTLDKVEGGGNGGNFKTGMFTYDGGNGNNHFPKLDIMRDANQKVCYMQNDDVTVTNASKDGKEDVVMNFKCDQIDQSHGVYWSGWTDFVNFGFSPSNDALYDGKVIKAMYAEWYKLPVLVENGKPMMLHMRVHDRSFMGMENAYWDGKAMTFGDGFFMFYPLVSLGVGAHEISHGFTEQHSNLVYEHQSGGLNESFSDMAAQAAEFYSTGKNTWQIGSDITKKKDMALRYMDDPTKDCKGSGMPGGQCSIGNANDYNDKLDVHFTSGVFNKAYYLLGTTQGWTARKAFDVMVQANMNYWTSNTSWKDAACGVVKATQDYKYDVQAVRNAFTGVGIDTSRC